MPGRDDSNLSQALLVLELEHYPGCALPQAVEALAGSRPLEQQRRAGLWPDSFDQIRQSLIERHGKQSGTKQMIELLQLTRQHGHERLRQAIEKALATGCTDPAAVRHLLNAETLNHVACEPIDIGFLERYERPLPVMNEYDQLRMVGGAQ